MSELLKRCGACGVEKPHDAFYRCRTGLQGRCKECDKARNKGRHRSTPEATRAWRALNPDADRQRDRGSYHNSFYAANRERLRGKSARWSRKNPGKAAALTAKRRAGIDRATPRWLSADDHDFIGFLYEEAAALSKHTGVKFHVDHEVPLRGKTVSGLHVPWNLRVIAASKNLSKRNKLIV